jgi:hypothetical protein
MLFFRSLCIYQVRRRSRIALLFLLHQNDAVPCGSSSATLFILYYTVQYLIVSVDQGGYSIMESVLYAQYIVATCPRHGQILRLQRPYRNRGDSVHYHSIKGGLGV